MAVSRYTVKAERSGKWWALQCVEVPGAVSQVARLDQAAEAIREAIAWVAEVPEEEVEIEVVPVLPDFTKRRLNAAEGLRKESARLNSEAAEQTRAAVGELHEVLSLTYREIGSLLKISHQRAAQLATEAKETNATTLPVPESVDLLGVAEFPEMEIPELISALRDEGTAFQTFLEAVEHSAAEPFFKPWEMLYSVIHESDKEAGAATGNVAPWIGLTEASARIRKDAGLVPALEHKEGGITVAIFKDHRWMPGLERSPEGGQPEDSSELVAPAGDSRRIARSKGNK